MNDFGLVASFGSLAINEILNAEVVNTSVRSLDRTRCISEAIGQGDSTEAVRAVDGLIIGTAKEGGALCSTDTIFASAGSATTDTNRLVLFNTKRLETQAPDRGV